MTRTVYDALGRAAFTTDPYLEGAAAVSMTQTVYDDLGRVRKTVRLKDARVDLAGGATTLAVAGTRQWQTETVYDAEGRVAKTVAADGQVTEYEYDDYGRRVATVGPPVIIGGVEVRHRAETVYDALGRVWKERVNLRQLADGTVDRAGARETSYEYDESNRVTKTTFADGTSVSATYDEFGRKASETNQLDLVRRFEYDDAGRLSAVELPAVVDPRDGAVKRPRYEYGYDAFGNQTRIVDPNGHETRFTFDGRGNQLSRTLPLGFGEDGKQGTADDPAAVGFTEEFRYDDRGRQTLHVSFEGVVTEFAYDPATGRLAAKRFFENLTRYAGGAGTPSEVWAYASDAFGRQVKVTRVGWHARNGRGRR
ncbi:MAG TPA: hypothetical protein VF170_11015 [Planctomycetaceae bacterium]